ncbi:flagellar filament capping protein FliD [Alicyclobacillus sp. SO9]|uniref:flagellar filament capping protein FliD n=1 Tax=Alicyclobacillus sp. SO9 TaxID=2665646 RepID=UPI0018E838A3|nr:flagellar filament capping protein FliD [Alicyclobacillus sp. SO9]QQE78113.1 flagellar filament capping protein FliD [Alicyclobacillus sp. SO9]
MSINSTNYLQQLNTISNPNGIGLPVVQYTTQMQKALQLQLTTAPNQQLDTLNSQETALNALSKALSTFQSATQTLASSQNWDSVTAQSSNSNVFSATTAAGAQAGSYSISVSQLAQRQTDIQAGGFQSTATGASNFAAGTLAINVGGTAKASLSITAGESLNSIVNQINAKSSTTGVQAQVISTGNSTNPYYLALSSVNTGSASAFSLSGTFMTNNSSLKFNQTQAAQDANMTIDGVGLSSSTNTFKNPIPNLTINAAQVGSGTLTISTDSSSVVKAVQTWMSAYNSLLDLLHKDTAYTKSSGSGSSSQGQAGPLFTDVNANSLLSQLPMIASAQSGSGTYASLASLGIVTNPSNGHLEFQSSSGYGSSFSGTLQDGKTMFENALASNPSNVRQVFGTVQTSSASAIPTSGILGDLNNQLNTYLIGSNGSQGAIQSDIKSIDSQKQNINNYLDLINKQIQTRVSDFRKQLDALNQAMQQSQAQMSMLSGLMGGGQSTSSSSGSSGTSSGMP